jgi:hypothetical protein
MSYYWGNRYQVIGTDCCLATTERMRLGAGGSFGIGNNTPTIHERYCFQTAGVAQIFAGILNRDLDKQVQHITLTDGCGIIIGQSNQFEMRSAGREVMRMDKDGVIVKLDMPYLVWCWLRTTAVARFLRTLWYGSRAE